MELLSPAGSYMSMVAAVQNGADAVYMGGSAFNARRFAANFDDAALTDALDYCHARGVKVYVTFNTLVLDREMKQAVAYGEFLCRAGADAALVQDLGLAALLRARVPGLPLHASTQMGIHDMEGALAAERMGMARAVLAREVSLKDIRTIRENTRIELEAFVHGALCMSFSGGCLYSSMAGERSGNRGTCAQPCRKRIRWNGAPEPDDYQLSPADLCMIEHLKDLERAGISCIKIEGRMKRAEYVAVVTRAYKKALSGADAAELAEEKRRMLALFDRGGGSTGYYYGDGVRTGSVAASEPTPKLLAEAAATYAKETRKRPVDMRLTMEIGRAARLELACGDAKAAVEGDAAQVAQKAQDPQRYLEQIMKLGDTPFAPGEISLQIAPDAFLPAGAVNELRRQGCRALLMAMKVRRTVQTMPFVPAAVPPAAERTVITAVTATPQQAAAAFEAGAEEVAIEPLVYTADVLEGLQKYRGEKKLLLSLPAVILCREEHERIAAILHSGLADGAIAANVGQLALMEGLPLKVAGTQMNAMNSETVVALMAMGFDRITLSQELTKPQMRDIISRDTAVTIYGRTQLMQLRHCPIREHAGCQNCRDIAGGMVDEAGRRFPLAPIKQSDGCLLRVLNCFPTDIIDLYTALPRPAAVQLSFYDESKEAVAERILSAIMSRDGDDVTPAENSTRGHWSRAVE